MSTVTDPRLSLLAAALIALFSASDAHAQPVADSTTPVVDATSVLRTYDIAPGALGSSLARIASESGETISVDADLLRGINAPTYGGRVNPAQQAS